MRNLLAKFMSNLHTAWCYLEGSRIPRVLLMVWFGLKSLYSGNKGYKSCWRHRLLEYTYQRAHEVPDYFKVLRAHKWASPHTPIIAGASFLDAWVTQRNAKLVNYVFNHRAIHGYPQQELGVINDELALCIESSNFRGYEPNNDLVCSPKIQGLIFAMCERFHNLESRVNRVLRATSGFNAKYSYYSLELHPIPEIAAHVLTFRSVAVGYIPWEYLDQPMVDLERLQLNCESLLRGSTAYCGWMQLAYKLLKDYQASNDLSFEGDAFWGEYDGCILNQLKEPKKY